MADLITVDASVFLNAFNPFEAGHQESHRLLAFLQAKAIPVMAPTLLLPEVADGTMKHWPASLPPL